VEKATSWLMDEIKKLLRIRSIQHSSSQPGVQHLGVSKFFLGKPFIFFITITYPTYKVFVVVAATR
jgi:uncharacterized membrane protein